MNFFNKLIFKSQLSDFLIKFSDLNIQFKILSELLYGIFRPRYLILTIHILFYRLFKLKIQSESSSKPQHKSGPHRSFLRPQPVSFLLFIGVPRPSFSAVITQNVPIYVQVGNLIALVTAHVASFPVTISTCSDRVFNQGK